MKPQSIDLSQVLLADRGRLIALGKRREQAAREGKPIDVLDAELSDRLAQARAAFESRIARHTPLSAPAFDDALPIAERRAEIAALIERHQVVIVCGETGSGKTTQLPKICLELGRGRLGMIGCTQPRRIAARSLATRLAKELGAVGAHAVGFKIRFNDKTDENTFVKVMTDGILLAETHSDRNLTRYDTLIIDEAHERSLNIDFLLGYVKRLLPKRPDLKVIITSATIDPQRFSSHFNDAPVIEVSGRTYPVEVRYRPEHLFDDSDDSVPIDAAVLRAVDELFQESHSGDVLVFLPGEREIRDCAESLRKHHPGHTEVLPLYSRLSNAEQDRVFQPSARRRIVLATNVAETSLTVPGIRYVIDTGVARIKRYSARSKINQLQIEPVSQASAQQRAGRCGRVEAGIAVRLYGEDDFQARPEFTTPEILRTSLADVILRMKSLGLGDVQDFPFVEPPFPKMIEDGYRRLYELGAVDAKKELTPLGWTLSKFPVDPAIARMLVAGGVEGVLEEVLVIAAALSVQDPRNRPHDKQQQADLAHERFVHPQSAFLTFLNLWNFLEDAWKHKKSNRKFDEQLHALFLSPLRVREWRDVHAQLSEVCASSGMRVHAREPALSSAAGRSAARETAAPAQKGRPPAAAPALPDAARSDAIHRALLTGLIGNVGTKAVEGDHYLGPRGMTFYLPRAQQQHAAQKKERLKWLMAAELTETTRVYARHVAAIDPMWIESVAPHLLTRSHFDPHWERKSGQVVAFEQVSLYGLIVNPKRRVHYGAINPAEAREIFIRQGLATGEVDTRGEFLRHNQKLIGEIEDIEAKARRQDILVDENDLFALYDAVVPADVVNLAGFEKWRKEFERTNPSGLKFTAQQLMRRGAGEITQELFPRQLRLASAELPLTYRFEPGHPMDGVTVTVPVAVLNQINAARFEWLVPGLLREKAGALMKSLPQRLRSQLVPLPETVSAFIEFLGFEGGRGNAEPPALQRPLIEALAAFLLRHKGFEVPADAWDVARLAPHLFMNVRVVDEDRQELAMSRDFAALQEQFADRTQTVFSTLHRNRLEREHILAWDFGELPVSINFERERIRYDGFPALVDCGVDVAIRIFDRADVARDAHRQGLVRLALLALHEQARFVERTLKFSPVAAFQYALFFPEAKNHAQDVLRHEVIHAAFAAAFVDRDGAEAQSMRDGTAFARALAAGKPVLMAQADAIARAMEDSLAAVAEIRRRLAEKFISTWEHIGPDVQSQLQGLFAPNFLRTTPGTQLLQYPRYLKALALRLDKAAKGAMERDLEQTRLIKPLWHNALALQPPLAPKALEYRWMVEELRVSLFAQELRTPYPVSPKRAAKLWEDVQPELR